MKIKHKYTRIMKIKQIKYNKIDQNNVNKTYIKQNNEKKT